MGLLTVDHAAKRTLELVEMQRRVTLAGWAAALCGPLSEWGNPLTPAPRGAFAS